MDRKYDNLIIVDQNIEKKYRRMLEDNGICVVHIGSEDSGCPHNTPDYEIIGLGRTLGNVPIATRNGRHFRDYGGIIIHVNETDSVHQMLKKTQKATKWKMTEMYL